MAAPRYRFLVPTMLLIGISGAAVSLPGSVAGQEPHDRIAIEQRKRLGADALRCERIPLGEADDYKPCIAQLPDGELLLSAFHQHQREDKKVLEQTLLFRSQDGGKTWSPAEKLGL